MKMKSLLVLTAAALAVAGCSSSNEPNVNPRLSKASTYSLSIYATDRANINVYSPKDDSVAIVNDEVDMEYSDEFDRAKGQLKRPITINEYRKNLTANSSSTDKQIIEQEKGKTDTRATPVMLKVFQLTDKSLFLSSTYDDFRGNDFADSLGKTYISNIDLIIAPNQFRFVDSEALNEKTHYIGVVALYNGYENRKWKGIVQVKPKGGESYPLLIRVLDSKVEIHKDN
ncbi:type VI secretion system lipoprotein TssJ [Aggregatibacter actinomycetemcomitans]|uniref:type VI secretion system lipoprotein TssJ n=1 Tax=Aggregatibacter actinomycetemcomitans TaxID=714 RepID=UPI00197BF4D0|nr:type VI secretion system lipoprotein TssJ [Aggregatibacter actinomycetemcomitans]MBN6070013.1 type VI secretion system lipoprotein TssJ [Aggregatibacter actinomycetemcomitans]MBN6082584.1 type VI secretion system lipoprotein TssJ [Aggregatibacter actinomycetemcomitans]